MDADTKKEAGVQTEPFADAQGAVQVEALLENLRDTLPKVKSVTLCNTLSGVELKALLDMVADTVAEAKKRDIWQNTSW